MPDESEGAAITSMNFVTSITDAPTVYADGCIFATRIGSVVRLVFAETILEPTDSPSPGLKSRHVTTIAMPLDGYRAMLRYLNEIAAKHILPELADGQ